MGFQVKVNGRSGNTSTSGTFVYHGNLGDEGKKILVYGERAPNTNRSPQTRRAVNQETIEQMLRGKLGLGTPGVNALKPFDDGRRAVDISNWGDNDPENPYRADFIAACINVAAEAEQAGIEIPEWVSAAAETVDA
jgi:hypothetical protein